MSCRLRAFAGMLPIFNSTISAPTRKSRRCIIVPISTFPARRWIGLWTNLPGSFPVYLCDCGLTVHQQMGLRLHWI
jgi:hypothetical protein